MRKVMLLKRVYGRTPGENPVSIIDDCEATFIQWGTDALDEREGEFTEQTIAVCEKDDGAVVTPTPTMIRFLDKPDVVTEKQETCKWPKTELGRVQNPHTKLYVDPEYLSCVGHVCQQCDKPIEVVE